MDQVPRCIYCNGLRRDPQMTLEHIWPQALGGGAGPDLFKSRRVCKKCNDLAGLWVDGAFLKSWFISHEVGNAARRYLDPHKPGISPLMFMGVDQRFPTQPGDVAELWMGPGGDSVHHVHLADDEKWYGFAGGDILRRKRVDAGRAYLMLRSESPYWLAVSVKSFVAYMRGARLFTATLMPNVTGPVMERLTPEGEATAIEAAELEWIRSEPSGTPHHVSFSHRLDFSQRFLAKLALGLGANLFGPEYCQSAYAEDLRRMLWPGYPQGDAEPAMFGKDLFHESPLDGSRLSGLRGAWSICLIAFPKGFGVSVTTPGGRNMAVMISNEPARWSGEEFTPFRMGQFYFVVPERALFVGPISTLDFIGHQNGHRPHPILSQIESMQSDPKGLPPLR